MRAPGFALAATKCRTEAIFVFDAGLENGRAYARGIVSNPQILRLSDTRAIGEEGCCPSPACR